MSLFFSSYSVLSRYLVTSSFDGAIKVWALEQPNLPKELPLSLKADEHRRELYAMCVLELESAPDLPCVLCGYSDGTYVNICNKSWKLFHSLGTLAFLIIPFFFLLS